MSSFVKLLAVLSAGLAVATAVAKEKTDDKSKKPDASQPGEKNDKKKKDKKKETPAPDPNAPPKAIDVPMPEGRDAKGLKIPYRDENGKLKMRFDIGVATKTDETHVQMEDLKIQTYDDEEKPEMTIDLPTSVLDLTTSVITTQKKVVIKREDFELTGNTMTFNTKTKVGGLGGRVRMLIYDLEDETPQAASTAPEPKKE